MVLSVLKVERDIEGYETGERAAAISPEGMAGDREFMQKFLDNLNPDARGVITKILEGKTLAEAGRELGFCRERARQIKEDTLRFLQNTPMYRDAIGKN
jgi:DNA-directed RNA polymerase sigma subunit (sigma70/sigma32)